MAIPPLPVLRPAEDNFARYYAEKLWDWIPEIYRHEDGLAQNPGVLRAIVEIIAAQAAIARRSVDQLWNDSQIDTADDWAVPYIGELVGGAVDEFAHTADFRRLGGYAGRWNIPKVNVHVFRQAALRITRATRVDLGGNRYTIDPSGRDVALFRPELRANPQTWHPV